MIKRKERKIKHKVRVVLGYLKWRHGSRENGRASLLAPCSREGYILSVPKLSENSCLPPLILSLVIQQRLGSSDGRYGVDITDRTSLPTF